ncbi:lantibiotic dehydratase C-terminal domain-containing protein [Arachnia propionica]|uniref:lantibiotic dehydratase C-terminal domain-containing protein n=1 Tax=Arachnia propionica TaxID=1750 RepID=UPI00163B42A0|nr:lantibiotic dehydratase C-terminal domain-containing protein [Arachnia propionica]
MLINEGDFPMGFNEQLGFGGSWHAFHIHYTSNPNPLLVECLNPLILKLRQEQLVNDYFFVRYWLEGPHVRLRLRASVDAASQAIGMLVHRSCSEFFHRRPAVYTVDSELTHELYRSMFLAEYSAEEWEARYGLDGRMPIQPNNTVQVATYLPEITRYGGPCGIRLSEWHFQESSRIVLNLLSRVNMHLRTVTFGIAAQMMVVMASVFIPRRESLLDFFNGYEEYWARLYVDSRVDWRGKYERMLSSGDGSVRSQLQRVYEFAVGERDLEVSFLVEWRSHCIQLYSRIVELTFKGELVFEGGGSGLPVVADDPGQSARVLLGSYLHMHNNRLGVTPNDEAYLAHVVRHSLRI